jgi:CRISPR/Cas system-associated exonuclease Cas4 (RecB family)
MTNSLQTILHDFVTTYPRPGQPAQLELTVSTHDPNRDTTKYRLSDAGKCRLMRYWKRQGRPATNNLKSDVLLQMQAGNLLHAYIERAVLEMGYLVDSEATLEDDHRIGHFDLLIEAPETEPDDQSYRILYDLKTITNKKAYYMEKNDNDADPQHIAQLVSYAIMYPEPLDELRLAYVVRDTLEMREVLVSLADHKDDVRADWAILISAWERQEPPAANPQAWECNYCQYSKQCVECTSPRR